MVLGIRHDLFEPLALVRAWDSRPAIKYLVAYSESLPLSRSIGLPDD
jgi:hypothetical protein